MSGPIQARRFGHAALLVLLAVLPSHATADTDSDAGFIAENRTAMTRMMAGMKLSPSGDVDRDFVAMMIPHHQGAVDMAQAELRYGRNEILRRLAQQIIVDQQQEIATMRLALNQPPSGPMQRQGAP